MDCMLDHLPVNSIEQVAITAIKKESYREFVDQIMEWSPEGCYRFKEEKSDVE